MTQWQDEPEVIELFGVRFTGRRDLTTGRIYVPSTPESKAGLTVLKNKGEAQIRAESEGAHGITPRSHRLSEE